MEWNPMYKFITYFRMLILDGAIPSWQMNLECLLFGLISLIIGMYVFYKKQDKFILYI